MSDKLTIMKEVEEDLEEVIDSLSCTYVLIIAKNIPSAIEDLERNREILKKMITKLNRLDTE